jgi:hypothetical protein
MCVLLTAHHAIHMQLDISANAIAIRAVQNPNCIVLCAVDCTIVETIANKVMRLKGNDGYQGVFLFYLNFKAVVKWSLRCVSHINECV